MAANQFVDSFIADCMKSIVDTDKDRFRGKRSMKTYISIGKDR